MRVDNLNKDTYKEYIEKLENHIKNNGALQWVKYLDLGTKVVRLVNYSPEFTPHIERQLTYIIRDNAEKFDATIVLWKEDDTKSLTVKIDEKFDPKKNLRARVEMLVSRQEFVSLQIFDDAYSKCKTVFDINPLAGFVNAIDTETNTYYYGVENLEPEEFIKEGHVLVQIFNKILKTPDTNLVHGAVIGLDDQGILFCARGQRGKSTLAVLSMMKGFEYVSDDYLILEKEGDKLYSSPIYSIITLSPRMYGELYDRLNGCKFVSNNARKDKYVINIEGFHDRFRKHYPIKFCMFPEIVSDSEPSIEPCPKGRAITQLIQSSVNQTQDINDNNTIKKLLDMVQGFEFYKINLCNNIGKNTACLKEFIKNFDKRERAHFVEDKMYEDITFDIANILDSENGIIYTMNTFATNVYENLKAGVSEKSILETLFAIDGMPASIEKELHLFVRALKEKGILKEIKSAGAPVKINADFVLENDFKLSLMEYLEKENKELTKENINEQLCVK